MVDILCSATWIICLTLNLNPDLKPNLNPSLNSNLYPHTNSNPTAWYYLEEIYSCHIYKEYRIWEYSKKMIQFVQGYSKYQPYSNYERRI